MALSPVNRVDFGPLRSCRTTAAAAGAELVNAPRTDAAGNSSAMDRSRLSELSWGKRLGLGLRVGVRTKSVPGTPLLVVAYWLHNKSTGGVHSV